MRDYATLFSLLSILFALFAAILWAASATVNLPVIGSAWGAIANLEPFYAAMRKVARFNAAAATCAFASAGFQALALYAALSASPAASPMARAGSFLACLAASRSYA